MVDTIIDPQPSMVYREPSTIDFEPSMVLVSTLDREKRVYHTSDKCSYVGLTKHRSTIDANQAQADGYKECSRCQAIRTAANRATERRIVGQE